MVQRPSGSHDLPADLDQQGVPLLARCAPYVPAGTPAGSARQELRGRRSRARAHAIRQITVLEVAGRLSEVVQDLDLAIREALAEGPRGVVCDLSGVLEGAAPGAVEVLATAGRHVRDWAGIPVAMACPDPQTRGGLKAHPLGAHLIVAESLLCAVTAVMSTPTLAVERLRLAAHPTARRASREFVARALRDWGLDRITPVASAVVSELVASSSINAGTDIDLSVAWSQGALRLTVRDHGPALPGQQPSGIDLGRGGLTVIAGGQSRAFGVLPTADGGEVVWAVLEAPRPPSSASIGMSTLQTRAGLASRIQYDPRLGFQIASEEDE